MSFKGNYYTGSEGESFSSMDNENEGKLVAVAASSQPQPQPRSILSEEEYTDTLTHIVTRDYFPSLHSLRRDNAILEARSRGDIATAVTVRRQYRREEAEREREWQKNIEEEEEAAVGTTSLAHYDGDRTINIRKRPRPLKHETVTGFHARVTSEDNAEFEMNLERERRDMDAKLGIVYSAAANKCGRLMIETALNRKDNAVASKDDMMYNHKSLLSDNLGLASDDFNATPSGVHITDGKNKLDDKSHGISKNGLFFEPNHHKQDGIASNSDSLLMPPPPTRGSIIPFQQMKGQPTEDKNASSSSSKGLHKLVEYIPKSAEPNINPPATRFPYQNESRLLPKNNPNFDDFRRSNSHTSDTSASEATDLDASPRSLERERAAYRKAKVRENETFIPMTPLIRPVGSSRGVSTEEEPMIGGNSAWEPSALLGTQPTYDIVDKSSREKMAQNAEKILMERAKTYRAVGNKSKRKRAESTPQSKSDSAHPFDRSASLTPAARALLQASNRNSSSSMFQSSSDSRRSSARSKDSFGSSLRIAYTPTPNERVRGDRKRRNSSTSAMLRAAAAAAGATPRINMPGDE